MTKNLPQMIDDYAEALAEYKLALNTDSPQHRIHYLKGKLWLAIWHLRDLGLNVRPDETET